MENEFLIFIPFGISGVIMVVTAWRMDIIVTTEYKDTNKIHSWQKGYVNVFKEFRLYIKQLTDESKIKKYNRIYFTFKISVISTPIIGGITFIVMIVQSLLDNL